jgi:uncharacterized protein (TIGR03000 family)
MSRARLAFRAAAFAAAGVLGLAAVPAAAVGGGGGGGRGGGGYHGGYAGGYHGGFYGGYHGVYGYNRGYYGPYRGGFYGYYRGYGWGWGGFGLYGYLPYPYFGLGVGVGYPGYFPYGVVVGEYYPPPGAAVPPPAPAPGEPPQEGGQQPGPDGKARLMLLVPADAQVWVDGQPTSQTGAEREFASPVLTPNKVYTYSVRVRSRKDDGRVSDETRAIRVRANDRWLVDFTRPAPRMPEAPQDGPALNPAPPRPR